MVKNDPADGDGEQEKQRAEAEAAEDLEDRLDLVAEYAAEREIGAGI